MWSNLWLPYLIGPALVAAGVLALELMEWLLLGARPFLRSEAVPEGTTILLLAIVIAMLYRYGRGAGLSAAAAMIAYRLYYLSSSETPLWFTRTEMVRAAMLLAVTGLVLWLVGGLHERAKQSAQHEASRKMADAHAAELEAKVAERTAELSQAYERMRELDRLKTDLVNAVSHELRTPLTSIKGFAEFLEDGIGGALSPAQHEFVAHIQGATSRLERLVNDLLDFARLEAGTFRLELQERDLTPAVREVVASLLPSAQEKGLRLEFRAPSEPMVALADANRVEQVLTNLIANAIKFTPEGGRVTVTASRSTEHLAFCVEDDGIGIPEGLLPRIFDKFFQVDTSTSRERGGAGLGLAISKSLVEAHGGRIGVDSRSGEGARFWFELPLKDGLHFQA